MIIFLPNHKLQQYLPLAVLKLAIFYAKLFHHLSQVATVLTACGIETPVGLPTIHTFCGPLQQYLPLAVLKLV